MTGQEVFKQALSLLNYTDADGNWMSDADLQKRSLALINQIYADLWYVQNDKPFLPLISPAQPLALDPHVLANVMPYGVAMLIAQTDGDADNQALYAALYNQRRASARSQSDRIINRQPYPYL